jgi:hypothetical protein
MNLHPEWRIAIGIDFEPRGNEGRLQFAWPVVSMDDDRLAIAEEWESASDLISVPAADLVESISLLSRPIAVSPSQGILVMGQEYVDIASSLEDPNIAVALARYRQFMESNGAWLSEGGHWCLPATYDEYGELARTIALQAKLVFDAAIEGDREARNPKARRALSLFEAEPLISYEDRIFRRLLYFRASSNVDSYLATLEVASARLGESWGELERRAVQALDVLRERWPFERAINTRAKELLAYEIDRANIDLAAGERLNQATQGVLAVGQSIQRLDAPTSGLQLSRWSEGARAGLTRAARPSAISAVDIQEEEEEETING